jgi:hypothetical protein
VADGIHSFPSLVHTATVATIVAVVAMHVHWEDLDCSAASTRASTRSDR